MKLFKKKIDNSDFNLPTHIGIIMDGNGRWAQKRAMPRSFGHTKGAAVFKTISRYCRDRGIKYLTVYAFSTENFKRDSKEVEYIFKLPKEFFDLYLKELKENNVQLRYIGHMEMAPKETADIINDAIEETKNNTGLILTFAFIYGGRDEIVQTAKIMAEQYKNGQITSNSSRKREYRP